VSAERFLGPRHETRNVDGAPTPRLHTCAGEHRHALAPQTAVALWFGATHVGQTGRKGTFGLITAAIGNLMMPWKLYTDSSAYVFRWSIGYLGLMGAIGGLILFWVFRGRQLSVGDRFRVREPYSDDCGVNRSALIAIALAFPVIPGFIRAATTPSGHVPNSTVLDTSYAYAWFVTSALGFTIYLVRPRRASEL
jgi:cytosine/uracil/thiamine/allantoin permease